ncbi:MAG: crossover junction endodeoxyribonuclease RuvC [Candidatus Magasanikbacteria bacterium CG_4_10_14_0_2_um_filter_33_14]|uniref:Crossover junction endodeoxyribonuclease RuvC n=1 Tax=Candidatus Magasanikbacteria bacterium CG_4_10_14_0_2_um_filter_33_14 TaxID=1974636 RepID=A0A2M7VAE5_9BACT|nr:MAG: crossover junction endodeoxyribonuclease RuvC [Candidatus Magasanikbacteria bacterium CG_4_10_14_0_2_um_filter_33_14]
MPTKKPERILGIDPGFGRIGWGVIEHRKGKWVGVAYGCIETNKKADFVDRLLELSIDLTNIIKKYKPEYSAVEELFFYKNVTTGIKVGQARGVILLTLKQQKVIVYEYTPLQIKQSITGYGRAEKGQLQRMVKMMLGVKKPITPDDAADALAVALTCSTGLRMLRM